MSGERVVVYDTTLRDGAQTEGIAFTLRDKLAIAEKLDDLGVDYVEGGWPGSNPKDMAFFEEVRALKLRNSKIAAYGATRRRSASVEEDANIEALLKAETPTVALVGKSWPLHVRVVLKADLEQNLDMIRDSVAYLKSKGKEVFFDAEHFFDGYLEDPVYAVKTLIAAQEAGADCLVLCETNGGRIPSEVSRIVADVASKVKAPLGIHCHNDSGNGVANTLAAVEAGAVHVQGTVNGLGERCGNADLCVVIPNLALKMGRNLLREGALAKLTDLSRFVYEVANVVPCDFQPYVGQSAFAHKGGIHVDAVRKDSKTYEHIDPALVGSRRRVLVSELSGTGTVLYKIERMGFSFDKRSPEVKAILDRVEEMESRGYHYEGADASFEMLVRRVLGKYEPSFKLISFRVAVERTSSGELISEAAVKLAVGDEIEHTVAEGDGPVNALDLALRKALDRFYPSLRQMRLSDFKVRVINAKAGTAAAVRVLVESSDGKEVWNTVGVSENIIGASWEALVDAVEYKLCKDSTREKTA